MEFEKRLTAPSTDDKYWKHTRCSGLNSCLLIGDCSTLPNCVGYAWGRAYELLGSKPKLSRADAQLWYGYNDGYKRGQEPKLGAIACWKNDFGHVAVVEEIKEDGTIVTSESVYGGARFRTMTYKPPYVLASKYKFQGFIYIGEWEEPKEEVEPTPEPKPYEYKDGDIVIPVNLVNWQGKTLKQWDDEYRLSTYVADGEKAGTWALIADRPEGSATWARMYEKDFKLK